MADMTIQSSDYKDLQDQAARGRELQREVTKLETEVENREKALNEERWKRKTAQTKREEAEKLLTEKDEEIEKVKEEFADFDTIKENAEKWNTYNEEKTAWLTSKLEELTKELWEEVMEKNSKFIDSMNDEVKIEYLESLKGTSKKEDFSNKPWENTWTDVPKIDERLSELKAKKETWWIASFSPSEKIEYLNLSSQSESK